MRHAQLVAPALAVALLSGCASAPARSPAAAPAPSSASSLAAAAPGARATVEVRAAPLAADTGAGERVPAFRPGPLVTWGPAPKGTLHTQRVRTYDLVHQVVHVRFDWSRHAVIGRTTIRFTTLSQPVRDFTVDAVGMRIGRVTDARGRPLRHDYDGRELTVHLVPALAVGDTTSVTIAYESVRPKMGAYFIDRVHYIWTQGETMANRYWVPTYDYPNDKETWEFYITVPKGEKALSNGRLVSVDTTRAGVVWHWKLMHPASTYLMTAAVGDYTVLHDHWRDVPVDYWVYPDSVAAGWRGFGMTPEAIKIYSHETGIPYPWSKYDQVAAPDFIFGGMENVTATTQNDNGILHPAWAEPERYSGGLVAHELGHQWFGDMLTTADWGDIWLNEGFATFMEQTFTAKARGRDEGDYDRFGAQQTALAADRRHRRPIVWHRWVTNPFEVFFGGQVYQKGATVLQMLRHMLGDSTFWAGMHRYAVDNRFKPVVTADLEKAFEQTTGRDLSGFFKQWVYGAGYPAFRVSYTYAAGSGTLSLDAREVQPRDSMTGYFDVDVDIRAFTRVGPVDGVLHVRDGAGRLDMRLPSAPLGIEWDRGGWLLDVVDFPRPTDMLVYQLVHAQSVINRIHAMQDLARRGNQPEAAEAVARASGEDAFWGVRARAAALLPDFADRTVVREALLAATHDPDPRVREAAVRSLSRYPGTAVVARLRELATSDRSDIARGVAVRSLAALLPADQALAVIRPMLEQSSWLDVLRTSAIAALAEVDSPDAWTIAMRFLPAGHSQGARETALSVLVRKSAGRQAELARAVEPLLNDPDLFIRSAAARALGRLGQPSSVAALEARRKVEAESRVVNAIDAALAQLRGGG